MWFSTWTTIMLIDETIHLFVDGRVGLVKDIWVEYGGFLSRL